MLVFIFVILILEVKSPLCCIISFILYIFNILRKKNNNLQKVLQNNVGNAINIIEHNLLYLLL
jgi:hypothetical protein